MSRKRQVLERKIHLYLYVIQFYVVIVFHLVKQSAKPLVFLFFFFSSAWLWRQSSWYRNSFLHLASVCRPSELQLSLYVLRGFLLNFSCCFPWVIRADDIWIFEKKTYIFLFHDFCSFRLTWDPTGANNSKRCYSYKWQPKGFKLLLNLFSSGPHKTTLEIFEF